MKKSNFLSLGLIVGIILISILNIILGFLNKYTLFIFVIMLIVLSKALIGYQKNKSMIEKDVILSIIAFIIFYYLVTYIIGYFTGFTKSIYAHDMATWIIDGKDIKEVELSSFSKYLDSAMIKWLDKYNDNERKTFTDSLFMVFDRASVKSLDDILNNKKLLLKLIVETKGIDKKTR